ncbi:LysE family translocator [Bacillus alveayuensis]|uniref:LysE family translocator n=1 Tax=Aeribacillus alveayuensis TaxID=279215 RepID=UPI0005CCCFB5|nr:LysE family translocator [Bacillus alveayuensis]
MDLSMILTFLGASILLTVAPGPDNLFVISQSMAYGFRAGFVTSLGLCTGLVGHTAFAAFGISAILYQSSLLFQIIKIIGAVYLLYLAWGAFQEGKKSHAVVQAVHRYSCQSLYKKGIYMNLLNPKVSLFFLAFLPQFISPNSSSYQLEMLFLGLLFILQAILIFTLFSALSGKIRNIFFRSPKTISIVHYSKAFLFAVISGRLLWNDR